MNKIVFIAACAVILTACGPSQAELDTQTTETAESAQATQTARAPTSTLTPTNTQTPTVSSTSTSTPTNTVTPTPVTEGTLMGTVFWADIDQPIAGVVIALENLETITDAQGSYSFDEVERGSYSLIVRWEEFAAADVPCSGTAFTINNTILGNAFAPIFRNNETGNYVVMGLFSGKVSITAGEVTELDIVFSCG
ncbi:MAG: carboxypeptidase regulatory-like domain-containing protein [Chloroflexi bacterium]|nr:carboxypeptidase regulatory-like domain-containing protein [Chloroflexota bacterium]